MNARVFFCLNSFYNQKYHVYLYICDDDEYIKILGKVAKHDDFVGYNKSCYFIIENKLNYIEDNKYFINVSSCNKKCKKWTAHQILENDINIDLSTMLKDLKCFVNGHQRNMTVQSLKDNKQQQNKNKSIPSKHDDNKKEQKIIKKSQAKTNKINNNQKNKKTKCQANNSNKIQNHFEIIKKEERVPLKFNSEEERIKYNRQVLYELKLRLGLLTENNDNPNSIFQKNAHKDVSHTLNLFNSNSINSKRIMRNASLRRHGISKGGYHYGYICKKETNRK